MTDKKTDFDREGDVDLQERKKTQRPRLFRVVLHNDDYTTMEFVVYVLMEYFHKTQTEATQIMLHVHKKGKGICGRYTYDVAETKVQQVTHDARENGHPLRCTMEPDQGDGDGSDGDGGDGGGDG
jgi:ATP-dependent Clp protease adaptor protein ClpS